MNGDQRQDLDDESGKPVNPNLWGLGAGLFALVLLPITHFTIGFPSTLYSILILPFIIGVVVRWSVKLNHTNSYRDD